MASMASESILDFGLGDWCPPPEAHRCPRTVTSTAYYFVDALTVSRLAAILGKNKEARKYMQLAHEVRDAFRKQFLNLETGKVTGNGQTSMSCALYQGLVDEAEKDKVLAALVAAVEEQNRHIDCGILGAKYVMHALTELGRVDLAYAIATQTDFPSWGHWIKQGATTLWETWNGNASRIHHMFSDISAWFYKGLAGIKPDLSAPGFKNIIFQPNPVADLSWVRAWHNSMYGRIACNWTVNDDRFILDVAVPPNCTASVSLPTSDPASVRESGQELGTQQGIRVGSWVNRRLTVHLESGEYSFTAELTKA